jgi:basic membrane protein A
VPELRAAGVNVAFGQDCTMDPWYSLGSADMLEVAHMGVHAVPMTSREAMEWAFDSVTLGGARAMGLPDPTLRVGGPATMVLLQARDRVEAIRLRATRLAVIREGRVLSRTPAREARLSLDGRPETLDPGGLRAARHLTHQDSHGKDAAMTLKTTRRTLMMGAAATLVLPAYIRRVNAQSVLRVAGVHASPVENAWNSRIHLAMQQAAEAGLIEYEFSEGVAATDYPRAMREYAESRGAADLGRKLCRGARGARGGGGLPGDGPSSWAPPAGRRATISASSARATTRRPIWRGCWPAPCPKAMSMAPSAAYPIPEVNLLINAFRMGVSEVNPDATFVNGFLGAWFDPARAQEMAIAQIDQGADILFGERIGTADGAQARGVKAIGSLIDYTPRYPETVFANAIWELRAHHRGHRLRRSGGQSRGA